jgi:succinoglycan biosynthesis protein ExoM
VNRVVICISTLDRPDGLGRILRSLAAQTIRDSGSVDLRVVVVNNDPDDPRPASVAEGVAGSTGLDVEVVAEPRRGVAPPRNRGLGRATELTGDGDLIGFLDDDEEATPDWLAEMMRVKRDHAAEIVTGPVVPRFEIPPPAWVISGRFFAPSERPTGAVRPWAFTNNVLFDAGLPHRLDPWFDEGFLRLSEDRHFFQRLARTGARIVWAADAPVIDYVPPARATAGWLIRRMRTVGRCVAPLRRDIDGTVHATVATLAKSPVWILIGAATTFAGGVGGGKAMRVRGRSWIAYGIGLSEGVLSSSRAGRPSSVSD